MNPQEDNQETPGIQETKRLLENKNSSLYVIEKIGFLLILISGLAPYVHSFVKHVELQEKFFGFSSIHLFLYSFGVHLSTFLLVIGVLLITSIVSSNNRYKIVQKYLKLSLISPFISGVFYLSWVFVPNVNYDILSYIFLSLFIAALSLIIFTRILRYINTLKHINQHKEKVVSDGMDYLKSKLSK